MDGVDEQPAVLNSPKIRYPCGSRTANRVAFYWNLSRRRSLYVHGLEKDITQKLTDCGLRTRSFAEDFLWGHDRSLELHLPRTGMTAQTADDNSTDRRSSMTVTATSSPSSTPVNVSPSGCGNRTPTSCSIVAKANSSMSKGRELPHTGTDSYSGAGGTLLEREERTHRISSEKSADYATIPHLRFQWCLRE